MFIKARKFFNRKNKKGLYDKYINDYNDFNALCKRYEEALHRLNSTIEESATKTYVYDYLIKVKVEVTNLGREAICYTYQDSFSSLDIVFTIKDYVCLMRNTKKMAIAIGKMDAAFELLDYLKKNNLTIRRV